jgi:betaine-aldehyde dehydrogenase
MSLKIDAVLNFIDGSFVETRQGRTTQVVNPATARAVTTAADSTAEDVDDAVRAARKAFESWRNTTPAERSSLLLKLADTVERHQKELALLESIDAGKPIGPLEQFEIPIILDTFRFNAAAARCLEAPAPGEYTPGMTSFVRREPVGVVGQVAPWNYPLLMAAMKIAPALAAGNTVVLKPAPTTSLSTSRLAALAADILPKGVLNIINGGNSAGQALVDHDGVDMVSLTGSVETGRVIARSAADSLKRVHLELGGKAPVIVFADADLNAALDTIGITAFYNAGQDCTAATRILVDSNIYDTVVDGLVERASSLIAGDPLDRATTLGPLNSEAQVNRVAGFIARRPKHVEIRCGGTSARLAGYFFQPTVLIGLEQGDELAQREIFGPVVTVQRFADEAEALRLANGTQYGLGSSIWTRDLARALRVSSRISAGTVWVNTHNVLVTEMPFGGHKKSGYGRDFGIQSVEEYTQTKHVLVNIA